MRAGVLAAASLEARHRRLVTLTEALSLQPLPVDDRVAEARARLCIALRHAGRHMPVNDSWIAATAIAHDVAILTRDADYDGAPGLTVQQI